MQAGYKKPGKKFSKKMHKTLQRH